MAVKKFSLEAVIDLTDKMTKPMQNVEKKMLGFGKRMQKNFGGVGNNLKALDSGINKLAVGAAAGLGAIGVGAFAAGKSFVEAGAEVEKYKTTLTTMLGSQELANKRFDEYSKLAATTPFELNDIVELGNGLQALGQYSKENVILLGDLAAASGKPIDQVRNAFGKLVSGQKGEAVNMFRDLLISTKDWQEATGKGISKSGELMATTDEMMAALPKILGKKGFSGMMDNLSKTYGGMSSNFQDTITRFKQGIGSVLLPAAKNLMGALTQKMMEFTDAANQKGQKVIEKLTKLLDRLADAILNFDIGKFIDDLFNFFKTIKSIWSFVQPFLPFMLIVVAEIKLIVGAMTLYNAVMTVAAVVTNGVLWPVLAVIAAVALLAVGIVLLIKHWAAVKKFLGEFGNGLILLLGPIGVVINNIMILVQSISGIGAAFKNGGFLEGIKAIGATVLQMLVKPLAQLLSLVSKIPGVGGAFKGIAGGLTSMSSSLDQTINGHKEGYANPTTRVAESRSTMTSTTRNVVDLQAPAGWGMTPQGYGGAPRQTLNFGGAQ